MKSKVLDVQIDMVDMEQAINQVSAMITQPKPQLVVTANSEMVMLANRDPLLYEIMARADLVVPDGIGVIWASRLLSIPLKERVPGVELMQALLEKSATENWRIFLLGSKPGIADQAADAIRSMYSEINIVGTHHGFFRNEEDAVLTKIKAASPDILFIALGVPKQEKFAAAHLASLGVPVAMGVGGSFEIFAGAVKRAPAWMRKIGLEWLYRLLQQPTRIGRMLALPQFVLLVLWKRLRDGRESH